MVEPLDGPIQLKRRRSAAASNPYLAEGERIEEFDTGRAKVGPPGGAYWDDLPYTDERTLSAAEATVAADLGDKTKPIGAALVQVADERLSLLDPRLGADPTGVASNNTALQTAFDWMRAATGGSAPRLFVPPGQYKLSRVPDGTSGQMSSAAIMRGEVEGAGDASAFFLDPASANPSRYYPIRVGQQNAQTEGPVTFRRIKLTGNGSIVGSSVMGFAARHTGNTLHSDNVTVEDCTINDVAVAVGCTKDATSDTGAPHRNWRALGNRIDTTSNKAIEFGHCDGGWMTDNWITNAAQGPQAIWFCKHIWMVHNWVRYLDTGIQIAHSVDGFWILDNDVELLPSAAAGAGGAALFIRTEPQSGAVANRNGKVRGNRFANTIGTTLMRAMQFQTRTEVTSALYERITFRDNTFDGHVLLHDPTSPTKTTIQDLRFVDNMITRTLVTVAQATCLVRRVRFRENEITAASTVSGSDFQFRDDVFTGGLTLAASSSRVRGTVDGALTDSGTGNTVTARSLL